jgi:hypothetical protein
MTDSSAFPSTCLETLLQELATFPDGKFDDQVDALSVIGTYRKFVLDAARRNAERDGRWAPAERERLASTAIDHSARLPLKPHEQRYLMPRGLRI